jgi:hypothetical protein
MTIRYTRNGALRFLRVGRIQLSWCICKAAPKVIKDRPSHMFADGIIATVLLACIAIVMGA